MTTTDKRPGWIGVDLDGTLAHYDEWRGELHIGDPIPEMVARIKAWLAKGQEVRIFTARVGGFDDSAKMRQRAIIQDWLEIGCGLPRLEVTATKDYAMVELWDDRAVTVVANTGKSEREHLRHPLHQPVEYFETVCTLNRGYVLNPIRLSGKR